jgi:hypothetical protein
MTRNSQIPLTEAAQVLRMDEAGGAGLAIAARRLFLSSRFSGRSGR